MAVVILSSGTVVRRKFLGEMVAVSIEHWTWQKWKPKSKIPLNGQVVLRIWSKEHKENGSKNILWMVMPGN